MSIRMNESDVNMSDNEFRDFAVGEGIIHPGFSYTEGGLNSQFSMTLADRGGMEGVWFEPVNYFPQLYEKIEWGLRLPPEVELAIDNWINNDQHGTTLTPAINPFDPDQIDVHAIVDYTDPLGGYHSQPVFGFFYQDMERITVYNNPHGELNMDGPNNFH
jgi:hypothetical protein